jgi:hypothetical protein
MENIFTWTEFNESYNKSRGFHKSNIVKEKEKVVIINQMTKIIYSK